MVNDHMTKYLVAPLNWGLGHASRCVPLIQRLLDEGHEVILGGDGESLTLLRRHFPKLRYTYLAPLNLRYSAGKSQVWAMLKALPKLLIWSIKDHLMLQSLLREEHIDCIISDNRFGLYLTAKRSNSPKDGPASNSETVYITHQLHIKLPKGWRWAERIASRLHARVYTHYNKVWVPDYEDFAKSLAGELSHPQLSIINYQFSILNYIGPLSRFSLTETRSDHETDQQRSGLTGEAGLFDVVAVLSGLEPQRTALEKEIIARYQNTKEQVLIVQGLMHRPSTRIKRANLTIVPTMGDAELMAAMKGAKHIIARSGYSTIMDLEALGVMGKAELIPTPGQTEQEYLAFWLQNRTSK